MRKITKISANSGDGDAKLRVAAYCRVSTDSDEQLVSLETQKAHYKSYIKANREWEFAGIYYDEGITGTKKEKRTALLKLLADCETGKIDFIITKSISRFTRNTTDCLEIVRRLTDLGIFIYFEKESINTQSMDSELMLTILSSLAENESMSTSQNQKWAIQRRFRNGTYKLSSPPYGYDYLGGRLVVNKEQAAIVKRIFFEVLSGKGTQKIADGLNADGILAQRGTNWTGTTIRSILGNEKYTGDVILQKTYTDERFNRHVNYGERDQYLIENHHQSIISHEDFKAADELLNQRGKEKGIRKGSSKYQNRYPLSGKIKCSECCSSFKRRIHGSGVNKYTAWCCSKHIHDISKCSMRFIREDAIHKAFIIMINKLIFGHKFVLKPLLESLRAVNYSDNLIQVQELERKIEENAERGQVLMSLMTKGYLEPALFNTQNNELRRQAALLKEKKEALFRSLNGGMTIVTEVEQLLKHLSKASQIERYEELLFNRYVEKVIVYSQVEIGFKMKCGITLKEGLVR